MNTAKYILSIFLVSLLFTACQKDFLNRYPLDQVTEPVFFKSANDLKLYVNQYYDRSNFPISGNNVGDLGADVYILETSVNERLRGTRTVFNHAPSLSYAGVRTANYFLENYHKCEEDFDKYKQYVGEAFFFRAFFYFNLLRSFGGVPWVDKVLGTSSPELYTAALRNCTQPGLREMSLPTTLSRTLIPPHCILLPIKQTALPGSTGGSRC